MSGELSQGYVALVDDSEDLLHMMTAALTERGHRVFTATGLAEAQCLIGTSLPKVIVTDLRFRDGSGLTLIEWVKERWPHLPIIVLTASRSCRLAALCGRLGAVDYFVKPYHSAFYTALDEYRASPTPGA
jgi:DNA-binding NtrC family response regulator